MPSHGVLALAPSACPGAPRRLKGRSFTPLGRATSIPLICLCDQPIELSDIALPNVVFLRVPALVTERFNPGREEFAATLSKLWAFTLYPLERVVFLDCDVVVLRNIDSLFDLVGVHFSPDYVDHANTRRFNSGAA